MKRKKSFTLTELLIVVVIVGILVSVAIPAYNYLMDQAEAQACQANLEALQTALDIYAMEHDEGLPGTLGQLPDSYINRAYVQLLQRPAAWKIRLAYFLLDWRDRGLAFAQEGLMTRIARGQAGTITKCPSDKTGGVSYGLAKKLRNKSREDYRQLGEKVVLIADCDSEELRQNNMAYRHKVRVVVTLKNYAQFITKGKKKYRWGRGENTVEELRRGGGVGSVDSISTFDIDN
jgi:prepilin-type N-terminal cleavage/methylation domain-containing protein